MRMADTSIDLVTGAAGFLGSHLCDRLVDAGRTVVAIDDLSTGDLVHLQHRLGHPRFEFREADVVDPLLGLDPPGRRIGRIWNLACPASPAYYQRHPVRTTLTSVVGVWHLLELAERHGARLLQVSTSEVYGDPERHPQDETYHGHVNPVGPRSCYDEGKRCAEALAFAWRRERGAEIRIARLFNSYGPRLTPGDGRVVSNFVVQALRGEPLTVYGDGSQTRSFCFVDDTVEGLLRTMAADIEGPVNIGNPDEHTVLDLAHTVLSLVGGRSRVVHRPLPEDDPQRRRPDISLARRALGWTPTVPLAEGLVRTIEHFRRHFAADAAAPSAPDALVARPATPAIADRWRSTP